MAKRILFISMLGEQEHFDPSSFTSLCPSGLEKDWVVDWHGPVAEQYDLEMISVDICRGEPLPPIGHVDSVILGGTMHIITEDRPWLHNLNNWLQAYRKEKKPLLGICGGHQLLSTRFGTGELVGRHNGTLAGPCTVDLTAMGAVHPLFKGLPEFPSFHFANYLHVLPSKEQMKGVLAIQQDSPAIAIDHGANWYSCQFHPESRKASWDHYYSLIEPDYESAYTDSHHGQHLLTNFFEISA